MLCVQAFQDIWANERLLNVAEQLLGTSDIIGHPVWNLRCKTPNSKAATVPWHQGYTVWILPLYRLCYLLLDSQLCSKIRCNNKDNLIIAEMFDIL